MDVIARLDAVVDDFARRCRFFNTPTTLERAQMFVRQHRLNTRQRNSVHKLAVATNCPHWEIRMRIIGASAQELIADNEFGAGRRTGRSSKISASRSGWTATRFAPRRRCRARSSAGSRGKR